MTDKPKILIGCECSGITRDTFIRAGFDAWSCDILPTKRPGPHYQCDVLEIVRNGWDLAIFHPDCTYLTVAGAWAFKDQHEIKKNIKPGTLVGRERRAARDKALKFFETLLSAPIPRIATENPAYNFVNTMIRRYDQVIHPHQFGHDASKATGLWIVGDLPLLQPTSRVEPRYVCKECGAVHPPGSGSVSAANYCNFCGGKCLPRWGNQTNSGQNRIGPSDDRWYLRAETYQGWADAMVDQWGGLLK